MKTTLDTFFLVHQPILDTFNGNSLLNELEWFFSKKIFLSSYGKALKWNYFQVCNQQITVPVKIYATLFKIYVNCTNTTQLQIYLIIDDFK